ncbi:MAG: TlpA disulfide reductase family protein [Methylobacter sp.]|jgi:peroxiredoxin
MIGYVKTGNKIVFTAVVILALILMGCSKTITSAPDVTFTTITGEKIALKDLRGKPVIVTFWATDCPSCIKEIPHLIDLYTQYHARGLEVIAVAMYYDPPNHVVDMTKAKQLPYNVALDLKSELAMAFGGIMFTPSTFLIAPDGSVVKKETGLFDLAKMKINIESLLKG